MVTCEQFELDVAELALGHVDGERRDALLEHASGCVRCHASLTRTVEAADGLLLLAQEAEPPAGFESRVLARTFDPPARHQRRGWAVAAAVVAALALGAFGGWALRGDGGRAAAASADIVARASGSVVGHVQLVGGPTPSVLVTITSPNAQPGVRTCELQRPDGSWVTVGTWTLDDVADGFWATAVDPALVGSGAMRVVAEDGSVLATANFG